MQRIIFLLLLGLLHAPLSAATDLDDAYYQQQAIKDLIVDNKAMHFLVLGDWGRNGHFYQKPVAAWMDVASFQLDAEFIVTTGDNFYDNGVASVQDPYWRSSFEDIYHQPHLFIDWYAILGNHDYRGNWQAQIDYTQISRRWQMPAPYYEKTLVLDSGEEVLLLFIDTSPLNPDYDQEAKYAPARAQGQQQQLQWIERSLRQSHARWKIVIGHHPLYSSGKRYGKTTAIRDVLEPILEKYQVDAYFAGHEHDLQHNQVAGKHTAHFVSGGGSEIRPVGQYEFTRFAKATGGFAAVSVSADTLRVQFVDHAGNRIYNHSLQKEQP